MAATGFVTSKSIRFPIAKKQIGSTMDYEMKSRMRIEEFQFSPEGSCEVAKIPMGKDWPVVYLIHGEKNLYIGETTSAFHRFSQHLVNHKTDWIDVKPDSSKMKTIAIIFDEKYNKSAILDIEQQLIRLCGADDFFMLRNENAGQSPKHDYYQREAYVHAIPDIWTALGKKGIAHKPYLEILNSDLFKYSPYTSLTEEQDSVAEHILDDAVSTLMKQKTTPGIDIVTGQAGTGKTILAMSLVNTFLQARKGLIDLDDEDAELQQSPYHKILAYAKGHPDMSIAYVVPMVSLRNTLRFVFKACGMKKVVMGPFDIAKKKDPYDVVFVDESHRLATYKNICNKGSFRKTARSLGLNETTCSQLDWILKKSKFTVLFYDAAQSIKGSDIPPDMFETTMQNHIGEGVRHNYTLSSQMRCEGGNAYVSAIDDIMHCSAKRTKLKFEKEGTENAYEVTLYDSCTDMVARIKELEEKEKLCRVVAGYSWKWRSKGCKTQEEAIRKGIKGDITIEGQDYFWNMRSDRWILSDSAVNEIGCVHTTQGYDLNYCAVIFGREIDYDKKTNSIVINPSMFYDANVKKGAKQKELDTYIINAYLVMLKRGIKGTFIYACNENLRNYLSQFIDTSPCSYKTARGETDQGSFVAEDEALYP